MLDLEHARVAGVAAVVDGADVAVFSAGGGPGSGIGRKDTVDRAAAVLLADAGEQAGVRRYLLVSSTGGEAVAGGAHPGGMDEVRRLPAGRAGRRGGPAGPAGSGRHGAAAGVG